MNEAEDALSSKAWPTMEVPSGTLTETRQVIRTGLDWSFMAVLVTMVSCSSVTGSGVELMLDGDGKTGTAGFSIWVTDVEALPLAPSMCNSVWWGLSLILCLHADLYCLTKWFGPREFKQNPLLLKIEALQMYLHVTCF